MDIVPVNRRLVTFDPTSGVPVLSTGPVFTRAQVSELALAAASQLYVDPNDELAVSLGLPPSRFWGMTNLEVMLIKQAEAAARTGENVDAILDRIIGKPKQSIESHKVVETYEGMLQRLAKDASIPASVDREYPL
jgi:hypothetical protein